MCNGVTIYKKKTWLEVLHLCASKMRMEPLLFADENAPEWAFSKRKGVKKRHFISDLQSSNCGKPYKHLFLHKCITLQILWHLSNIVIMCIQNN